MPKLSREKCCYSLFSKTTERKDGWVVCLAWVFILVVQWQWWMKTGFS